ncbi:MAG TPA: exopolyphosphatase [Chromatiales bacterium]|nr:exopolyphosphatase [Chromatiales bacterium]
MQADPTACPKTRERPEWAPNPTNHTTRRHTVPRTPKSPPETVAAVDLGSNSFHMLVARLLDGQLNVLDRLHDMVRLAGDLGKDRRITPEAATRAIGCLERFGQRLRHMPPGSVRAVGTNTLRSARNAKEFLDAAERALGHPIEIISGVEEARLIYAGVAHGIAGDGRRRLVMDIGGGSTELIVGESSEPLHMESLYMGCVNMSRAHFADGQIGAKRWRRAVLAARSELEPHRAIFRRLGWADAIGASGTLRAVYRTVTESGWSDAGITLEALRRLRDALLKAGRVDRIRLPGVSATRAPVFPGGVAVVTAAFEALDIERMRISDSALREGLLYDLIGRIHEHDGLRARTIANLAARYNVDTAQAERVRRTALELIAQTAGPWALDEETSERLLEWAAGLHEIGLGIAHSGHHKHAAYVLANADLAGFSRRDQILLATVVRAHRRRFPTAALAQLPASWIRDATRLSILLRLSVVLHRSRSPHPPPPLRLIAAGKSLALVFPDDWLEQHPLTQADLGQEAAYLKAAGYELHCS